MDGATTSAAASSAFSSTSFVILSVSVVGILATTTLLLAYYLFLTRCGLLFFWRAHPHDVVPPPPNHHHIIVTVQEHAVPRRGLEEAAIRRIPTFRYRSSSKKWPEAVKASECAVCLAEFRDGERLRLLPPCLHAFHIDCIDAWLQATATCPLCRAAIASDSLHQPLHIPSAAAGQGQDRRATDDIAIDISSAAMDAGGDEESPALSQATAQARRKNSSMGGEERVGSDGLAHQPMRRSLSMDSCSDKRFYLALQRILQQQQQGSPAVREDDGKGGETSAAAATTGRSRRLRRSFFSFSQSRGSRSASILPL
ncbi:hypothetical protein ACP70R_017995 [Stipagrostis hirtigluma subsp. patula]